MAKLPRVFQKVFASLASNNGVFGSAQDGTKVVTNDLAVLQGKAAYGTGWDQATVSGKRLPALEEFQGLNYINTSQIAYIFQEGVPEYDPSTQYHQNSIVKQPGTARLYVSLTNNNTGNPLTNTTNWLEGPDLASSSASGLATLQLLTTTGAGTWNKPAGARRLRIRAKGAGGAGGVGNNVNYTAGPGGGEGGLADLFNLDISALSTINYQIGAGGTNGGAGGTTSFGTYVTATGGAGGANDPGATSYVVFKGALGGTATGGDKNDGGTPGGPSIRYGASTQNLAGNGGGVGGGLGAVTAGNGGAAQALGAGGGGGCGSTAFGNGIGGPGGNGYILLEIYK